MNDLRTAVQQFLDRVNCVKEEHAVVTYDDLMLLSTALEQPKQAIDWSDKAKLIDATHHARAMGFVPGTTNWASAVSSYMLNAPNKVELPQQQEPTVKRTYTGAKDAIFKLLKSLETKAAKSNEENHIKSLLRKVRVGLISNDDSDDGVAAPVANAA